MGMASYQLHTPISNEENPKIYSIQSKSITQYWQKLFNSKSHQIQVYPTQTQTKNMAHIQKVNWFFPFPNFNLYQKKSQCFY